MQSQGSAYRKSVGIKGEFDQIVIGSGMGGLGAASLLAQRGHRVLVLEQNNVIGGLTQSYERAGYKWTVGLHYVGEVGTRATMTRKLFDHATGNGVEWAPMPEIFNRVVIGQKEYPIPAGLEPFRDALKSWFPNEGAAIDTYLQLMQRTAKSSAPFFAMKSLPQGVTPDGYIEANKPFHDASDRITLDVLSDLTENRDLIAVLCANWGDYGIEPTRSSFAMHCMLAKHYLNGGFYPVGGGSAFADAMVPIIERAGGKVLHSANVEQVLVANGAAKGVRLTSGEEVICPTVISNAGVRNSFGRMLDPKVRSDFGLQDKLSNVVDSYAVVGLNIGLEGSAAELNFDPANIWYHPSTDFSGNLADHQADFAKPFAWTFITFPSAKDPSWDREFSGKSTIEMYACSNFRHFEKWSGTRWMKRGDDYLALKARIERRLMEDLCRLVPQVDGRIRHVEVSTPLSYETFVKRQRGDFMGIESSPSRFRQDWLRAQTPIPGLYLTGQDVATDGVIGALVGGVICVSSILGRNLMQDIRSGNIEANG
ncbi:MAG: NAD(P)-binding protein [Rhizobiales bacterium]|nr:NAD(P)-binding protein [Hyphomicrobiales bacterium]